MNNWPPQVRRQAELKKIESLLVQDPFNLDLLFQKATFLHALGLLEDAKNAYMEILKSNPSHLGALDQLGSILHGTNFRSAALRVYRRLISLLPDAAAPLVHLGNVLWDHDDHGGARIHYEKALLIEPDYPPAHQGMAAVLNELRENKAAFDHAKKGYQARPTLTVPYRGRAEPLRVLVLGSVAGGNIPLSKAIDDRIFLTTVLAVEFQDPTQPLPGHQVVWNAIGEADLCGPALKLAATLLHNTRKSVINPPDAVAGTGRSDNVRRLAGIKGLRVPKTVPFSRGTLVQADAGELLASRGFRFPLLVRAQGFHAGQHFAMVNSPAELKSTVEAMPGMDFMVIEFMDARSADGLIRKYRAMIIGGNLYPLHAAIGHGWKMHYFSAAMKENAAHRSEDKAFLLDMAAALGPPAVSALQNVAKILGLDYAGIDFSVDAHGTVLFFEANATMIVTSPDGGDEWAYRRAPVQKVFDAVTELLRSRIKAAP